MRIFFADHAILNFRGHYYNYAKAVCREFQSQGYEVHVLGNKKVYREIASDLSVHKAFTLGHDHQLKELGFELGKDSLWPKKLFKTMKYPFFSKIPSSVAQTMAAYESHFHKDLDDLVDTYAFDKNDLVIINSIRHEELFAYATWIKKQRNKQKLPHFLFILHFSIYPCPEVGNLYRDIYSSIFSLFESAEIPNQLHFFTDSESLANEYKTITRFSLNVLPIPHNSHSLGETSSSRTHKKNEPVVLSYLGVALTIKGFQFIPFLLSQMKEAIREKQVLFQLQVQSMGERPIAIAEDRLSFYDVRVYPGTLSNALYYQLLDTSDILLFPYSLDFYHSQTSGVFSEAMSLGKIPIVPKGTWMAQEAEKFGVGQSFFPRDPRSFCEAVITAKENIEEERLKAQKASPLWNQFHSPQSFAKVIKNHLKGLFNGV